jgi:hypothetical protein
MSVETRPCGVAARRSTAQSNTNHDASQPFVRERTNQLDRPELTQKLLIGLYQFELHVLIRAQ